VGNGKLSRSPHTAIDCEPHIDSEICTTTGSESHTTVGSDVATYIDINNVRATDEASGSELAIAPQTNNDSDSHTDTDNDSADRRLPNCFVQQCYTT
jgi:hypothetical protein